MSWLQNLPLVNLPLYGIAAAALLIYVPFGVAVYARLQGPEGYDYSAPRTMLDKLPAYGQRASWAHQNGFESFILFAPAALMAYITGPHLNQVYLGLLGAEWVAWASLIHVAARLVYPIFYIANLPPVRSLAWAIGQLCTAILILVSLLSL